MPTLKQSQYLVITAQPAELAKHKAFVVKTGSVEVYACTPRGAENYHKLFLAQLGEGECFFSPAEVLSPLEFQVFARADCEIDDKDVEELPGHELAALATEWFHKLTDLKWIRYLIGLGDDDLSKWKSKTIFGPDNVAAICADNLEILSALIEGQFKKAERSVDVRTEMYDRYRDKALSSAKRNLLRDEFDFAGLGESLGDMGDPVKFAVCAAARFLGMDTANISIPADVAENMDPVAIMRRLIRKANMEVRLVSLPKGWHKSDRGAFIGFLTTLTTLTTLTDSGEENAMVALLPKGSKKYVLVDEDHPSGLTVDDEIASKIKDNAFMCYAGLPPRKLGLSDIFDFMLRHTMKHDWAAIWLVSLVAGLLPILMPLITETIFRDVIPIYDRQALGTVTQVMMVSGFTGAILGLVRSLSFIRAKNHAGVAFESALWSRLLSLPASFFRDYETGNLVGRMQGVGVITELLGDKVLSSIFSAIFSFWSLILMFYYNVRLTMISMALWAVYLLVNAFLYKNIVFSQRNMTRASNKASARTLQLFGGLTKFRLQGKEPAAFHLWSQTFGEEWTWGQKVRWQTNYISLINVMMPTVLSMVLFYVTMGIMETGLAEGKIALDAAKFMGFLTAFTGFNATLTAFVPVVASLFTALPLLENIMPILETEPEATDDKVDAGRLSGEVEIKNLHFAYSPDSPPVLKEISIRVKAGESVAVVGPSGCGKSTLVRLLLGFEKPTQGAIFFDGQDFSTLNAASVRAQMGVVLQNGQVMSGDIFSNIVGAAPLTLDDAWEAARMVGLEQDIRNMPMEMHTMISEGSGNISGGQRQRIMLARSIVNRPKIVLLDEATSALDNATQAIVTESIKNLKATRIVVAHRLTTVMDADRIYVLQDGRVAEEGNYEELMKANGFFAKMAQRQLE
ncbi:MAG: NHLP bacteriocin export ABC transporter permease/ATPase subunit [Synergistaceae bacterium]|nr:NHLP bacteriocin export ABC transporter permease/ATPase subunit [Synergistaceae bacterium]